MATLTANETRTDKTARIVPKSERPKAERNDIIQGVEDYLAECAENDRTVARFTLG